MKPPRIAFRPLPLLECQKLHWLFKMRAFTVVDSEPDMVFHWDYINTHFGGIEEEAINGKCLDVSKSHINNLCKEIYGYGSDAVNGWAIEKNDLMNGIKDIRLVELDGYERKEGYFYQRPLFHPSDSKIWETRLVVMRYEPQYKIMKEKHIWRANIAGRVTAYSIMPYHEDKRIATFCQRIGLDYGELDILNCDGLDYIIDVNPTPGDAAWVHMSEEMAAQYGWDYLELFKRNYHV